MTNLEKLRETFPKTIFIFRKNGNDETAAIMCSAEWLQEDYDQMYKDSAPCEDAVSRSEVLRIAGAPTLSVNAVTEMIKALPPVTPKPKTGKWICHTIGFNKCSCCGSLWSSSITENIFCNFCPRCGAKMEGENE